MTYKSQLRQITIYGSTQWKRLIDLAGHGLPQSTRDYLHLLQEEEEEE